jgi:hypothetical protein
VLPAIASVQFGNAWTATIFARVGAGDAGQTSTGVERIA